VSSEIPFDLVRMDVDGHPVLVVYGEVDALTSPRVHEALSALIAAGHLRVLVDLANVSFIDSSGLTALVVAHRHLDEINGELQIVAVPEPVAHLFSVTGLDERFRIYPSVEGATGAVRTE
jgi:anti-sigma B factor antagonist